MTAWGILSTARINRLVLAGARRSDRMRQSLDRNRPLGSARRLRDMHDPLSSKKCANCVNRRAEDLTGRALARRFLHAPSTERD